MKNVISRRILFGIYFAFGLASTFLYFLGRFLPPENPSVAPNKVYALLYVLMLLFGVISLGLYLFTLLFFHYRARYLMLLFLPLFGGLGFAVIAFIRANKTEARDFRLNEKLWSFLALLGLYGLDQTTGNLFGNFVGNDKMQVWQTVLDMIFFAATLAYFIYWGKKRGIAEWRLKNLWTTKWAILIGVVLLIAYIYAYPGLLSLFHIHVPNGDNQTGIDALSKLVPGWLMWLHLAFGAPVMEETIFRTGIYELISPKHPKIAFFASAISFASIHMMNGSFLDWRVWGIYLGMGFILSGIYYKTRKVETTAAMHFIWNGIISYFSLLP
ncbi:MAG: CPBP family intramembrane metalloprotease [Streptococcaceae bacterium]|jgi:membrane protease YdiL (CAAX protease family)|nr:CPBP family intramembrane metalloprotease [Streptococcaceae bacterium]